MACLQRLGDLFSKSDDVALSFLVAFKINHLCSAHFKIFVP